MAKLKKIAAVIFSLVIFCGVSALAGCGQTQNIVAAENSYTVNPFAHIGQQIDSEIKIDGVFDESFYQGQRWMVAHKTGKASAVVTTTTYFGEKGLLIAGHITDDTGVYYNSTRPLGANSYIQFYFTNGSAKTWAEGFYEMIVDVGMNSRMFAHANGYHSFYMGWDKDTEPSYALHFDGDDLNFTDGSITEYSVEMYFPYELLGWETVPESVYVGPVLLTSLSADGSQTEQWFVQNELSYYGWDKSRMFTFDENGFADNTLTIYPSKGGTVKEEHGDDFCVTDDEVIIYITPDEGNTLDTFLINGIDMSRKIDWVNGIGTYKFICMGDVKVSASFKAE